MRTKRKKTTLPCAVSEQPATGFTGPVAAAESPALYDALRRRVPLIDGAVRLTVHLCGGFRPVCGDPAMQDDLDAFTLRARCTDASAGLAGFAAGYLDNLLTYGTAIGECLYDRRSGELTLHNADVTAIRAERDERDPTRPVFTTAGGKAVRPDRCPGLVYAALDPGPGELTGRSALTGLAGVAGTLLEIFDTVETNWRRCGDVRYAVTYRPGDAVVDAEDAAKRIADAWSGAMRDRSRVRDFVAVGDVNVSPIGSADALPDPTRTVRMLIEQITAKLGVPPFLLGLSWTTSERMADRQTEIFTRRLAHYRKLIEPALLHVCRTFLRLRMSDADVTIQWEPIAV